MMTSPLLTPRLTIREFAVGDAEALLAIECDPAVTRFTTYDAYTAADAEQRVRETLVEQQQSPRGIFDLGVARRSDGLLVGRVGLRISRPEHGEGYLWYVFGKAHWGQGYASEATGAFAEFSFRELGLHRLTADCDPRNSASRRVAEKLGMRLEGHLRENYFLKGEWCDSIIYGLLASEWRERPQAKA